MDSTQQESNHSPQIVLERRRDRTKRAWKIAIRAAATVIAIPALALQIRLVARPSRRDSDLYSGYYYYYNNVWVSPESFVFLCLSLGWNCAEFITFCVNKRGIHPGAHVGMDLIIWGGLLSAAILQFLLDSWYPIAVAAASLKTAGCVLHFILFVWACVDTEHRRKFHRALTIAQVTAAVQQQSNMQQQQQQRMSTFNGNGMGTMNVPPGMALVPIEMLAQLKQPQASYQQYPAMPNGQANGQMAPQSPVMPVQGVAQSPHT